MASSALGIRSCAILIDSAPHPLFFSSLTEHALSISGEWNSKPKAKQIQRLRETFVEIHIADEAELLRLQGSCDQRLLIQ